MIAADLAAKQEEHRSAASSFPKRNDTKFMRARKLAIFTLRLPTSLAAIWTISRQLRRNRGLKGFHPQQAHNLALARRREKAQPRLGDVIWQRVEGLICDEWSPEQIVGRLEKKQGVSIDH